MSQDLTNISQEAFQLQIYKIHSKELVRLYKTVGDIINDKAKNYEMHELNIYDLERKRTKIQAELKRRKFLTDKDVNDWMAIHNTKKKRGLW